MIYIVSYHQSNHARIVSLRNTSASLDLQIKDTLTLLTDTRRALIDTPATVFPTPTNPVSYSDLLSYARRISKFTLPNSFRETTTAAGRGESPQATTGSTPKDGRAESQADETSTPAATVANGADRDRDTQMSGVERDSATPAALATQSQNTTTTTSTSLPEGFVQFLNPLADNPFMPWPTEETIRRGALASIQVLLDQNIDPATFDPAKSAELEAERKRIAEEEDRAREEQKAKAEEDRRREMERRMSISGSGSAAVGGGREQEKPGVFQLETFDDDEESD